MPIEPTPAQIADATARMSTTIAANAAAQATKTAEVQAANAATDKAVAEALAKTTPARRAPDPTKPTPSAEVPIIMTSINLAAENEQQMARMISAARQYGMSETDAAKFGAGPVTVTPEVREQYATLKARVMKDKAWVQRYMDGGQAEQALMWEINARLSADVVQP